MTATKISRRLRSVFCWSVVDAQFPDTSLDGRTSTRSPRSMTSSCRSVYTDRHSSLQLISETSDVLLRSNLSLLVCTHSRHVWYRFQRTERCFKVQFCSCCSAATCLPLFDNSTACRRRAISVATARASNNLDASVVLLHTGRSRRPKGPTFFNAFVGN